MPHDGRDTTDRLLDGVAFIEANLTERFALVDVAAAAGVSPYHYCRIFQGLTGDSVMGYARKRRLSEAALRLANGTPVRLIDLALDSGFESQAALTRAFKRRFGVAPGEARRRGLRWLPRIRAPLDRAGLIHLRESVTMEPRLIERDDIHIVGLTASFDQENAAGIPDLWRRFRPKSADIPCMVSASYLGVVEMTDIETGAFDYTVAYETSKPVDPPGEFTAKTLAGGRFAVFTHKIRAVPFVPELRQTMRFIYGTWLERSGEALRAWYDFEFYDERFSRETMRGEIDIHIPIK